MLIGKAELMIDAIGVDTFKGIVNKLFSDVHENIKTYYGVNTVHIHICCNEINIAEVFVSFKGHLHMRKSDMFETRITLDDINSALISEYRKIKIDNILDL